MSRCGLPPPRNYYNFYFSCHRPGSDALQVLGIIGALDPHTHKLNQADLQGEGKLEAEGVRPQRPPTFQAAGEGGGRTFGKPSESISRLAVLWQQPMELGYFGVLAHGP